MDPKTLAAHKARAEQWRFAERLVAAMRAEQGDGELNYSKPPEKMPPRPRMTVQQPVSRTRDRRRNGG